MIEAYRQLAGPRVLGMISGTSADAIDAALVQIEGRSMRLLRFASRPYPPETRELIFALMEDRATVRQLSRAHFLIGELFADVALAVLEGEKVDLIGSHGQTVAHLPYETPPSTLQIGEAAIIAEKTGTLVVSDFRTADLALGGQAAPLVPYFDSWLLRSPEVDRAAINIGGMANVSWVPRVGDVRGWDSGPGNVVSDALAERYLGQPADFDGKFAAGGRVVPEILAQMLLHPYFSGTGPKSTGREDFGRDFIEPYLTQAQPADLMRTALALTAETLLNSMRPLIQGPFEMVVGGGGYHNPVLMQELRDRAAGLPLQRLVGFEEFGITADAREACAFALMAHETLHGRPSSVATVTGARRPAILGKISFPS
ncbi:MAG: anhydro-N-acetylmuramic acid kinase [Candidatus Eremiobacteraeota bacterium]|nr:anhydro-N-acetylmuramic acid kinase [Candidatus Eremiobacteraeota bacterium]